MKLFILLVSKVLDNDDDDVQIQLCEVRGADDDDQTTGRSTSSRPSLVVVKMLSQNATDKAR